MEAVYETLTLDRVAAKTVSQVLLEQELPLPAGREAKHIVYADGSIHQETAHCGNGQVEAEGTLELQLLCQPPEGTPFGMRTTAAYRHAVALDAVKEGMQAEVTAQLQELHCRMENGRLKVSAMIELHVAVEQTEQMQVLSGVNGVDRLQTRYCDIPVVKEIPLGSKRFPLREQMSVSDVQTVLLQDASVQLTGTEPVRDGILVSGMLTVTCLCLETIGQMNRCMQHYQFEEVLPVQGDIAYYTMENLQAEAQVRDVLITPAEETEGLLDVEAEILLWAKGREERRLQALQDAYGTHADFVCVQKSIERLLPEQVVTKKCNIREMLAIPQELPEAYRSVYAAARPVVTGTSEAGGLMVMDGLLFASVIFQSDAGEVFGFEEELPFRCPLDVPYQEDVRPEVRVLHAQVNGNGRMLDVTFSLEAKVHCHSLITEDIAVDVQPIAVMERPKGILIYLAGEGEDFWNVGKRFGLTVEEVQDWNPQLKEPLKEGQQLLLLSTGATKLA